VVRFSDLERSLGIATLACIARQVVGVRFQ